MSPRRSPAPQPPHLRLGAAAPPRFGTSANHTVPLLLLLLLGMAALLAAGDLHLAAAARLARLTGSAPSLGLADVQLAKLVVLSGIAAMALGLLLIAWSLAKSSRDRRLIVRFAYLALGGGSLIVLLDVAQALDLAGANGQALFAAAETLAKIVVAGGCCLLLVQRIWPSAAHGVRSFGAIDAGRDRRVDFEAA